MSVTTSLSTGGNNVNCLAAQQPQVRHDVSRWRLLALEQGLVAQGHRRCSAGDIAEVAMLAFLQARSHIQLAPDGAAAAESVGQPL